MKNAILALCLFFVPAFSFAAADLKVEVLNADASYAQDQYFNYYFGNRWVNTLSMTDISLTATGDAPVEIRAIEISGMMYGARTNCPAILYPGQACITTVSFQPRFEGNHWGSLNFRLRTHNIFVRLQGTGIY